MNLTIHTLFDNLICLNSSLILELSVIFASQICHQNINKPLDGACSADFGIDISPKEPLFYFYPVHSLSKMLTSVSNTIEFFSELEEASYFDLVVSESVDEMELF